MKKTLFLALLCAAFLFTGQAYALSLAPDSSYLLHTGETPTEWNVWNTTQVEAILANEIGIDISDPRVVEGFSELEGGPTPVDISWYGERYLLLTDGNHNPWWYLFDLDTAPYDGVITLSGFWGDAFGDTPGQISNARFYGASVPEPSTILLLGIGLVGVAGIGRKRMKP